MPGVRRYFSVFWGPLLMLLKLFDCLSDGRTLLVGVLGGVLFSKNDAFWRMLTIIFSSSVIFLMKAGVPNPPKPLQGSTK